jgi:hypothetical protein
MEGLWAMHKEHLLTWEFHLSPSILLLERIQKCLRTILSITDHKHKYLYTINGNPSSVQSLIATPVARAVRAVQRLTA